MFGRIVVCDDYVVDWYDLIFGILCGGFVNLYVIV